jgi:hypothetical protein
MSVPANTYLLVIGEREALAWILRNQRMAFPNGRREAAARLAPGDNLLLLTTRGCYHNPGRDRTLIIGSAVVTSEVVPLDEVTHLAGRDFTTGCELRIDSLARMHDGLDVVRLVDRLDVFAKKHAWAAYLRTTLVPLGPNDQRLVTGELRHVTKRPADVIPGYLSAIRPVASQHVRTSS